MMKKKDWLRKKISFERHNTYKKDWKGNDKDDQKNEWQIADIIFAD